MWLPRKYVEPEPDPWDAHREALERDGYPPIDQDEPLPAVCKACCGGVEVEELTIVNGRQPRCWICSVPFGPFRNAWGEWGGYDGSVVLRSTAERLRAARGGADGCT